MTRLESVETIGTVASPAPPLTARTVTCEITADLLDLLDHLEPDGFAWVRNGTGFVTGGVAARVRADAVTAALGRIGVDDAVGAPGTGAIAVGSLPFRNPSTATLTVPAWVIGRSADGVAWRTEIGAAPTRLGDPSTVGISPHDASPPTTVDREPGIARARHITQPKDWDRAVADVLDAIDRAALTKVVLARRLLVETEHPIHPAWLLRRLRDREPGRYLFAAGGFVGASPELLIRRLGAAVTSRPLAGTAALPNDREARVALEQSVKERHEHSLVVDAITETLDTTCTDLDVGAMSVVRLADVAHLATTIRARADRHTPGALDLALALHPTPAVGGTPRNLALEYIDHWEPAGRGPFGGPVGWVDAQGDGEFAVALRCAELDGSTAVLQAGAGIVTGSDADAEWAEIDAKFSPVLHALAVH